MKVTDWEIWCSFWCNLTFYCPKMLFCRIKFTNLNYIVPFFIIYMILTRHISPRFFSLSNCLWGMILTCRISPRIFHYPILYGGMILTRRISPRFFIIQFSSGKWFSRAVFCFGFSIIQLPTGEWFLHAIFPRGGAMPFIWGNDSFLPGKTISISCMPKVD